MWNRSILYRESGKRRWGGWRERDETEHRAVGQGRERGKGGREKERGASVGRQISGSVDDHYRWDESILRKEKRQPAVGSFIKNLAWKMMDISRQESTLR